jgi:DNA-binding transcriptional MocR family regulator
LVELQQRMLAAGATPADAMTMPLTQKLIAEALGISHVHANRCCRKLEKRGLIETGHQCLTVLEPAKLKAMCHYEEGTGAATHLPEASLRRLAESP